MTYFTLDGIMLSEDEYVQVIGDAPLLKRIGNLSGWVKILSCSPQVAYYFPGGLVQPELDVQVGRKVKLGFEGRKNSCVLIDWRIEK